MGTALSSRVHFRVPLLLLPVLLLMVSPHFVWGQDRPSASELVRQFEGETVFWRQFEIAKAIVAANDQSVLPRLEPWLTQEDRELRGNAAYIFGRFGDPRGFDVIVAILGDRSEKRAVHEISSAGGPSIASQIRQDRYYAAHLLGDLKDARAVPVLASLLTDPDASYVVPWALGQIGDPSAIPPLIESLNNPDPNMRVLAIQALVALKATDALPQLRLLLGDRAKSGIDKAESVAEAAQGAIGQLQSGNR